MIPLLLATLLSITPKECQARPEWCYCRQFVAMEENKCEVAADELPPREQRRALRQCRAEEAKGRRACDKDDGDFWLQGIDVGSDE